jgi:hypothetical protein
MCERSAYWVRAFAPKEFNVGFRTWWQGSGFVFYGGEKILANSPRFVGDLVRWDWVGGN